MLYFEHRSGNSTELSTNPTSPHRSGHSYFTLSTISNISTALSSVWILPAILSVVVELLADLAEISHSPLPLLPFFFFFFLFFCVDIDLHDVLCLPCSHREKHTQAIVVLCSPPLPLPLYSMIQQQLSVVTDGKRKTQLLFFISI